MFASTDIDSRSTNAKKRGYELTHPAHPRITDGKIKTIGQGLVNIFILNQFKTVSVKMRFHYLAFTS
jgi:hypothetical protein